MRKVILLTALLFIVSLGFSNSQTKKKQRGQIQFSEIIKKIEKKFDVSITYETEISFKMTKKQAEKVIKMKTVEKALAETVKLKDISFKKIRSDYYVLSKNEKKSFETSESNFVNSIKERVITGVVTDQDGEAIPGATVVLEKTAIATMTDLDGKFSLSIPSETGVLTISYVGYRTATISITEAINYIIKLETDEFGLDEVIVSGVAGNTPTKKLTVTVDKVGSEQLENIAPGSAATGLQGQIAGVTIVNTSGSPGGNTSIRLRGVTSLNGNNAPLIIVDGIMVETYLSDFNADDIESYEVVKGAAASALYGSRAAGGVIVITTKRGNKIKESFEVTVRNEFGQSQIANYLDLATHHPYQLATDNDDFPYTKYENIIYDDDGAIVSGTRIETDSGYADQPFYLVRDLQKDFFKKGNYYTNYIGIASNSQNSNLFLSFENHQKDGIIDIKDGYSRKNIRFNADTRLGKYVKLSTSNLLINSIRDLVSGYPFDDLLKMNPDVDLFVDNEDGTSYLAFPDLHNNKIKNPYYMLSNLTYNKDKLTFMTNMKATVNITDWLSLSGKYTMEKLNSNFHSYTPKGYIVNDTTLGFGYLSKTNISSTFQTYTTTADFKKIFGDFLVKSKLSYMYEAKDYGKFNLYTNELGQNNIQTFNNAIAGSIKSSSYDYTVRSVNYFGIVDFDYKSKYLFSGLYRRDGSSLFGSNVRWNNYYRLAAAYRISEDINIPGVQELKIRAARGTSGLRPGFSYQYETYTISNGNASQDQYGNKNLRPSEATENEFALDANFLNSFDFSASYSITNTEGAFVNVPLPAILGFTNRWENAATINTSSLEFSLAYKLIKKKDVKVSFQLNFDKIKQQVTELKAAPYYTGPSSAYYIAADEPFGVLYGYKWLTSLEEMSNQLPEGKTINDYQINSDGYVILKGTEGSRKIEPPAVNAHEGESSILLDNNNDGIPDKVLIGDGNPDFHLGFSSKITYKELSLYFLLDWKQGGDVYNYTKQGLYMENRALEVDQFNKPDAQKKYTGYYNNFYHKGDISDKFIEDGSYLKLRDVSLFYNLKLSKIKFIKSVKIGVIAHNAYTFTKYSGYDPEVAYSGDLTTFAFDWNGYPNYRTISASLQIKF